MRRVNDGFTLIELMIVVSIVGILAAIAIPSFRAYVLRSKVTQGVASLGEIRQRQEAYRAEFGQYCFDAASGTSWYPAAIPGFRPAPFGAASNNWRMLGFTGSGYTYFRYMSSAGAPGVDPTNFGGLGLSAVNDFTFGAQAQANLDGDATILTLEILSPIESVYISNASGYE